MSGSEIEKFDLSDYEHPEWCDLTRCQPHDKGTSRRPGGCHQSAGTLWGIQSEEADFIARVVRDDDFDRLGANAGRARLEIVLREPRLLPADRRRWGRLVGRGRCRLG